MATVFLVRHADIALPSASPDPPLNPAGLARAGALARIIEAAGVRAIFTSHLVRTKQTAQPLAARLNITPQEAPASLISDLLAEPSGHAALIVGHSNTIPAMILALGVPNTPLTIGERDFDNLFIVTTSAGVGGAALIHLKYGPEVV